MLFPGIVHNAYSGMRAASLRLQTSAHNVANAQTDGFDPSRVVQQDVSIGGVHASVETVDAANPVVVRDGALVELSGTDLAGEMVEQLRAQRSHEANVSTLRTADEMVGTLLDVLA